MLYTAIKQGKHLIQDTISDIQFRRKYNNKLSIQFAPERLYDAWNFSKVSLLNENYDRQAKDNDKIYLSIIVPIFNAEQYLEPCLRSLALQKTSFNYEVICVNDGSSDNSCTIIKEFVRNYPEIFHLVDKKNGGVSSSRNTGLDVARGKYVSYVDADDEVSPNFIETLMTVAYKENIDIVKCSFVTKKNGFIEDRTILDGETIIAPLKLNIITYPGYLWGGVYRRSLINKVRFPLNYWYEDMITRSLIYRLAKSFSSVKTILYYKNSHHGSSGHKQASSQEFKSLDHVYLMENIVNASRELELPNDIALFLCMLEESSGLMVSRLRLLPNEYQQQAFLMARGILQSLWREDYKEVLTDDQLLETKIIFEKRFEAWRVNK